MPGISRGAAAIAAVVLSGCGAVVSTDAVLAPPDLRFDPRLIGTWVRQTGDSTADTAVVTRADGNIYDVSYAHHARSPAGRDSWHGRFGAGIGPVGRRLMLDFTPNPRDDDIAEAYQGLMLALHRMVAVEISDDSVVVAEVEKDSLLAALRTGRVTLPYTGTDVVILHATTPQLRAQLASFLGRPEVYDEDRAVWRRAAVLP